MSKLLFFAAVALALIGAILTFLMYKVPAGYDPIDKNILVFIVPTVIANICAIIFFLRSLKHFKPGLRLPYILLSAGIIFLPTPGMLLALAIYFDWYSSSLIKYSPYLSIAGLVLAGALMYAGMQRLASMLSVRSIWTKYAVVVPVMIVLTALFWGAVYIAKPLYRESWLILGSLSAFVVYAVFTAFATMTAKRIKSMLGEAYSPALRWLLAAFAMATFSALHELWIVFSLPASWVSYLGYTLWPYLLTAILFLRAGYLFWTVGHRADKDLASDATYIESIVYLGSLASRPEAIDPLLDQLRTTTARTPAGGILTLSPVDKKALIDLYYKLEDYLVNQEPLHKYTKEEIRGHLTYDFQQILNNK